MWQMKVVISLLSKDLWISNIGGYWLFCGCYDRDLRRRKLDNPSTSLLLFFAVKNIMLYQMLKKSPRYNGKLVLTKNKHKNAITASVNPVALKLEQTATGGV